MRANGISKKLDIKGQTQKNNKKKNFEKAQKMSKKKKKKKVVSRIDRW
jgi:hypothetical protein